MSTTSNIEARFTDFIKGIEGSESLDDPEFSKIFQNSRKADFLLRNRSLVIEIKTLTDDPEKKIDARIAPLRDRPEFPTLFWNAELKEVLSYLPDGEEIHRKIFHALTNQIQRGIRSANEQIEKTKELLFTPNACGVLVLLNEDIAILSPDLIAAKASELLVRKTNDTLNYNHVAYVWILSEAHYLAVESSPKSMPLVILDGPQAENFVEHGNYLESIQRQWAAYQKLPLLRLKDRDFKKIKFQRNIDNEPIEKKNPREMKRHEIWREDYNKNPYLKSMVDSDFITHAVIIIRSLAPSFLLNREKPSEENTRQLMIGWTHVLQEAENRRMDMNKIISVIGEL